MAALFAPVMKKRLRCPNTVWARPLPQSKDVDTSASIKARKAALATAGYTQRELAEACGVTRSMVGQWLSGTVTSPKVRWAFRRLLKHPKR